MKDEDPETISDLLSFVVSAAPYECALKVFAQRPHLHITKRFDWLNRRFGTKTISRRVATTEDLIANIRPEYRELALALIAECEMSVL